MGRLAALGRAAERLSVLSRCSGSWVACCASCCQDSATRLPVRDSAAPGAESLSRSPAPVPCPSPRREPRLPPNRNVSTSASVSQGGYGGTHRSKQRREARLPSYRYASVTSPRVTSPHGARQASPAHAASPMDHVPWSGLAAQSALFSSPVPVPRQGSFPPPPPVPLSPLLL